ncbi:MAG: amino acid ABC transporter ATP-binding protein, partial [Paraburkholderia sp.]
MIRLERVNKRFGDLHVLQDVSLSVAKGEVLCVVGPSGS